MASSKPACMITARASGPCDSCRQRAEPAHIVTESELVDDPRMPKIYCAACCPECRAVAQKRATTRRETNGGANP
jgi:hypothetical protein